MWTDAAPRFHALAWLLWLSAAMLAALLNSNPYYLAIITGIAIAVNAYLGKSEPNESEEDPKSKHPQAGTRNPKSGAARLLLRTVVALTLTVALFRGISLHIGATVLFTLPEGWPVIGGPITLEALAWALLDACSLLAVLAVFAAFSAGADYYSILRSVPPFLHQAGLVTSIAITFVPRTVDRFTEIREAQALRGHKIRRVGDLLPLVMPLLAGGMERSLDLAEAMEARGFTRSQAGAPRVRPIVAQSGIAAGLGLILVGAILPAVMPRNIAWLGWAVIAAGMGVLAATLRAMGRGVRRERYRRSIWRERDTALAAISVGVLAFLLTFRFLAPLALLYYPFPRIYWPDFDLLVALALLGLAGPVFVLALENRSIRRGVIHHALFARPDAQEHPK